MIGERILWRLGPGTLLGVLLFWLLAHRAGAFADWWLPAALLVGWCVPMPRALRETLHQGETGAPPWLRSIVLLALAALVTLIAWGALATASRHWDGITTWDARAEHLGREPSLQQPFFGDPDVFCHSRDYPILQPLLVAMLDRVTAGHGRLLFPLLLACLAALVGLGARRGDAPAWLPWAVALACAGTPMLVNPTSGGADSGYAELLLGVCVTAMAVGLYRRLPPLVTVGAVLAVASKPEGVVYAAVPVLVGFCCGDRRALVGGLLGLGIGVVSWLPVHERLHFAVHYPWWTPLGVIAGAALVVAVDALLRRRRVGLRGRCFLALVVGPLVALSLPLLLAGFGDGGTMGAYLGEPARLLRRLPRLPAILWGFLDHGVLRLHFGAAFVLPAVVLLGLWRSGRRLPAPVAHVAVFCGIGLLVILTPFLLSPEEDVQHHLRSSMTRLQLHWAGSLWLLFAAALPELLREEDAGRPAAAAG